jgi:Ni/Co efflux regulator RcnB
MWLFIFRLTALGDTAVIKRKDGPMKLSFAAAAIALPILLAPALASAQPQHRGPHNGPHHGTQQRGPVHVQKQFGHKPMAVKPQRWHTGRALPSSYRRHVVKDYRHHGLRAPRPGQRWVKVDRQYILINSVSGMIASIIAAR